jgi:hypothetical protein
LKGVKEMQIVSFSDNALGGSINMAIALGSSVAFKWVAKQKMPEFN